MENMVSRGKEDQKMDLPPGFRFHPTDEELITFYLTKKAIDSGFIARAIGEVDLNKCEPWDLPGKSKMGEKEWYFFCVKDRKYPTGLRTNRATDAGYWKATGKDKEIFRAKTLVGMKKTLVFYKGRAPKGEKSDWVMHEYRLEGKFCLNSLSKSAKNEWVLCRIFKKNAAGKKIHESGLVALNSSFDNQFGSSSMLPPLMDSSLYISKNNQVAPEATQVPCFSSPMEGQKFQGKMINSFNSSLFSAPSNYPPINLPQSSFLVSKVPLPSSNYPTQNHLNQYKFQYPSSSSSLPQDQSLLGGLFDNNGSTTKQNCKTERDMVSVSQETGLTTEMNTDMSSVVSNYGMGHQGFEHPQDLEPISLDSLWNY